MGAKINNGDKVIFERSDAIQRSQHGELLLTSYYAPVIDLIDMVLITGQIPEELPGFTEKDLVCIRLGKREAWRSSLRAAAETALFWQKALENASWKRPEVRKPNSDSKKPDVGEESSEVPAK